MVSENAAQLSTLFASTLGGPMIKTAAFTYGVRQAVTGKRTPEEGQVMRKRLFWFAVGVGLTALVVVKGREYYERFTPKGVAEQFEKTRGGLRRLGRRLRHHHGRGHGRARGRVA